MTDNGEGKEKKLFDKELKKEKKSIKKKERHKRKNLIRTIIILVLIIAIIILAALLLSGGFGIGENKGDQPALNNLIGDENTNDNENIQNEENNADNTDVDNQNENANNQEENKNIGDTVDVYITVSEHDIYINDEEISIRELEKKIEDMGREKTLIIINDDLAKRDTYLDVYEMLLEKGFAVITKKAYEE